MLGYWWVIVVIIMGSGTAYFSKYSNDNQHSLWPVFVLYALQCVGLWPIVARYSNSLFFDGLLYDVLILLTYYGILIWCGAAEHFTGAQWFGTAAVLVGILLVKLG